MHVSNCWYDNPIKNSDNIRQTLLCYLCLKMVAQLQHDNSFQAFKGVDGCDKQLSCIIDKQMDLLLHFVHSILVMPNVNTYG